ncbi:MAG: zinc metallopeptidase [Clostridia bacterium]|nr:zinc metallopeptidase [Clostridia bacterium]
MPLLENLDEFKGVAAWTQWAIFIVGCLIAVVALVSIGVSIWLAIKYVTYNRRTNSRNLSGAEAARIILDKNGLQNIKVSVVGSLMFGNSYSHYFHKVRIRRLTNKKPSITSLAMGAEKSALAILDKEGDKDMKTRVALTPLIYFGPLAFIPIIAIGVIIDILLFGFGGVVTAISAILGLGIYVVSFILSISTLKTEVKAQARACDILKQEDMATDEEIDMMKELFKLYNIQYINDIILEFLQMILKVLEIIAKMQQNSSSNN